MRRQESCLFRKKHYFYIVEREENNKRRNNMKKIIIATALLLIGTIGYANSLERFINKYKEKEGAAYIVFNRDYHFNDASEKIGISMAVQQLVSCTFAMMGIEEMVALKLDSCTEYVRSRFVDRVYDAIPKDYTLLSEEDGRSIYMSNSDEEFAYMLIVNENSPGLTLSYVTNTFVRAIMNEEGDAIDQERFEQYVERRIMRLEEAIQLSGERLMEGIKHLEKRIQERVEEWEQEYN